MPKAFLSHSSKDKGYARTVADHLGAQRAVLDERSFEEGLPTLEEILRTLEEADLFVLLISDPALDSEWVKKELGAARDLHNAGTLARIFPIIIDARVTHADPRIPSWVGTEYNLKLVSRPTVAARRVEQQLRRLSWQDHPELHERQRIFVGRNELIQLFEQRFDSLDSPAVNCLLASGIPGSGRRSLMRQCLIKASLIKEVYEPPVLALSDNDSIEDLLQRLYDFGFSEGVDLTNLLTRPMSDKVELAIRLLDDAAKAREVIFAVDGGAIAAPDGELSDWFRLVVEGIGKIDRPVLAIASRYRPNRSKLRALPHAFSVEVPELDAAERAGLLKRYAEWSGLALPSTELQFIAGLLSGFPEQVLYAVDMVKDEGVVRVHQESFRIVEFSTQRVSGLIDALERKEGAVDMLRLLGEFEFVSEALVLEIAGDTPGTRRMVLQLKTLAVCESIGAAGEYLRLNEAVRDYVIRTYALEAKLGARLEAHLRKSIANVETEEMDVADLLVTLKTALLRGDTIPVQMLIPSHFLRAVKELYDARGNNREVVALADRALQNDEAFDERIIREIRSYKVLALARQKDARFFEEMRLFRSLPQAEYEFFHGFYYRQTGNLLRASQSYRAALGYRSSHQRARNELARVYLQLEAWALAIPLAREAHMASPNNSYYIRTLYEAVVRSPAASEADGEVRGLLDRVGRLTVRMASEMFLNGSAQYAAYRDRDRPEAEKLLEEAMRAAVDAKCHLFTLCEVRKEFGDVAGVADAVRRLMGAGGVQQAFQTRLLRLEVLLRAMRKDRTWVKNHLPDLTKRLPAECVAITEDEVRRFLV